MSEVVNTTPIVTTVTKIVNKEKTQKERDKVNIQDFCVEHYDDILPIIIDKVHRDKRKEVHTRLDFAESSEKGRRTREGSQNSSAGMSPVIYHTSSRRPRVQDRLRYNDGNMFNRLSRILPALEVAPPVETALDTKIASETLKSRTMVSTPPKGLGPSTEDPLETNIDPGERGDGGEANLHHSADLKAAPVTRLIGSQKIKGAVRVWFDELPPESIDSYKDLKAAFLTYFIQQKKHVKDLVEIHNIKQKDGETIEEFIKRFKVETGRMKGAPECMRISGFMHGVNNPELMKRLNEHVPKTLEEMMITTTAFIRGETAAASKKKVHTPCVTTEI
ncbi:reverse transcriptase domain-containing protein [Tanacetum coccineum]